MHGASSDVEWLQKDFGIYLVGLFDTFNVRATERGLVCLFAFSVYAAYSSGFAASCIFFFSLSLSFAPARALQAAKELGEQRHSLSHLLQVTDWLMLVFEMSRLLGPRRHE